MENNNGKGHFLNESIQERIPTTSVHPKTPTTKPPKKESKEENKKR